MSWFRRAVGLDAVDVIIQAAITVMLIAAVGINGGDEEIMPMIAAGSLVVLAVRRARAQRLAAAEPAGLTSGQMAATRLEELEQRVAQLEHAEVRIAELEERLDFAERLLAQGTGERALPKAESR